ncbi:hypothetical protein K1719_004151 [Acacia pycnantha]|nr:hypothetical protein K1719_004151 [Acacia pycnantha]
MAAADVGYMCFVFGLPRDTDREALQKAFASFGEITDSKVINNCGFVTFSSEQAMRDAVEGMNGRDLNGDNITASKHSGGPNGRSGDHGGGSGLYLRHCDVRRFHLGGLVVGLILLNGGGHGRLGLGLGLRFGGRGLALGLSLKVRSGLPSVAARANFINFSKLAASKY